MKYSISVKFVAIILCALSLVSIAFNGVGIAFMEGYGLYQAPLEDLLQDNQKKIGADIAGYHAQRYAAETFGNCPQSLLDDIYGFQYRYESKYQYVAEIWESEALVFTYNGKNTEKLPEEGNLIYSETVEPAYPVIAARYYIDETGSVVRPSKASDQENTYKANGLEGQEILYSREIRKPVYDGSGNSYQVVYVLNYYPGPEYEVRVRLAADNVYGAEYMLIRTLYNYRNWFVPALLMSFALFAVMLVYLCADAGRNRKGEIHLAAINRIPLDLYGLCTAGGILALFMPVFWLWESGMYQDVGGIWDNPRLSLLICCICGFGIALCAIGFVYAFAAQIKASNGYWLRHTLISWCLRMLGRFLRWIGRGIQLVGRACRAVFELLPVIWQWVVTTGVMALIVLITTVIAFRGSYVRCNEFFLLLLLLEIMGCVAVVLYGGWCLGTLLKGVKHMSQGDLKHQISTKYMIGSFKEFAIQLNSLAGAAQIAAQKQMKSERMKTELITNVSHDIKTPLTSIINYVDLMKKPHSDAEGDQYLEVLDRQSQRLKKLVDDLMEMSKANSGTMNVELTDLDAVETVNQALGEFSDKMEKAGLTPVFRHPEMPVIMRADGRLVWRVLSNVLNNAVKYAMPDTRLYVDLMVLQGNAVIAIKNISREQLNVSADELMERFVRGDSSRNTEGSGLGLNIAKSLVELQRGQMHLMVDGDLFKVTLIFPCKESS